MTLPLIVSYGAGRDSTALIIELHRRGIRPDAILFANVGSEKKETHQFIRVFDRWLASAEPGSGLRLRVRPEGWAEAGADQNAMAIALACGAFSSCAGPAWQVVVSGCPPVAAEGHGIDP